MREDKMIRKLIAMVLSVIMVVGMTPVSAAGETGRLPMRASGEISAVEELAADIVVQNVPLGTSRGDLKLPDALIATIQLVLLEDEVDSEADSSYMATGPAISMEETGGASTEEPSEIRISLPVTWASSPAYDGDTESEYIFIPVLPEGYTFSAGLEPPKITVRITKEVIGGLVTVFDELPDDIRWQNTTEPKFPETLVGMIEDKSVQIPVTWQADHDYDPSAPLRGLYVFTAALDEAYILGEGLEASQITVFIPETSGRITRFSMGGDGTDSDPLEITTGAQLREIAVLVGAGRLERFLFNDVNAKISLTLINDIDLSPYGKDYDGGKGWEPIGNNTNAFKGKFDGNGKAITWLYINRTTQYTGLFGFTSSSAHIKNLRVLNANVTGGSSTGIVAGGLGIFSTLEGCHVTGMVSGASSVGGVAGRSTSSSIKNCRSEATVNGSGTTGGVMGSVYGGALSASYSTGAVSGNSAGGVVGSLSSGMLLDCYATGGVTGGSFAGGVVGNATDAGSNTQRCAALNPFVSATGTVGRVLGHNGGNLLSNIAFSGMSTTVNGVPRIIADGENTTDGFSMNAADIKADGTLGNRFSTSYGWVRENGKLPGFGAAEEMPGHITDGSDPHFAGEGTAANPYQIATPAQLKKLADLVNASETNAVYGKPGLHYKLLNNLDLTAYGAQYNGGQGWKAIGNSLFNPFRGVFDGNGKLITGLYINNPTPSYPEEYAGLFGCLYGTVKYLGVVGDITGRSGVGLIAGQLTESAIVERCFTDGKVHCLISNGGGIVGTIYGENIRVRHSYSTANVSGRENLGGIAGRLHSLSSSTIVEYCYATGTVTGAEGLSYNIGVGGIVGMVNSSASSVQYCAGLNLSLSGTANKVGRVVGYGDPTLRDNYAFEGITVNGSLIDGGDANDKNGSPKTAADLKTTAGFPVGMTSGAWHYVPGSLPLLKDAYGNIMPGQDGTLPYHISETYFAQGNGSVDSPYLISTAAQLVKLAELVNMGNADYNAKHYQLTCDIDLSTYGRSYNGGKGWEPIGLESDKSFKGHFDGYGKVITGLYISRPADYTGLFGYISGATLKNLGIADTSIKGGNYVGGIAGGISGGSIQGCYVTGSVNGTSFVGGIAGDCQGSLENCYSWVSVIGSHNIGGVAGGLENGSIQSCYAIGSVSGPSIANGGGIVGKMQGIGTKVENCVALNPSIAQGSDTMGRVVGYLEGTLGHNYAFSGMTGTWEKRTHDGIDGEDVTIAQANYASFWRDSARWSTGAWSDTAWTLADDKLPILKNVDGTQSGDGGIYLMERDISKATVVLDSESFVYTGQAIQPDITVNFGGQALIKNVDYIVAVTSNDIEGASAGINTGIVTLKIAGEGNFKGWQNKNFTIAKATPAKANLQYDLTPVTYTGAAREVEVSLGPSMSGLGVITVKYHGNSAKPINAGEYAVTVEIAEGSNFTATAAHIEMGTFLIKKATGGFVPTDPISTTYAPTLKLGDISLPSGYEWSNFATVLDAGNNQSHQMIYTDPSGNYEDAAGTIIVNVAKATGTFIPTDAISTTYSLTLKLDDIDLPVNYGWNSPTTVLNAGSDQIHQVIYTDPGGNYESATGNIIVNVAKATGIFISTDPCFHHLCPYAKIERHQPPCKLRVE